MGKRTMNVIILERVPASLRGELSRWLIEPKTGTFIGYVSAMVRDRLWRKCCQRRGTGGVIQIWSTNNEQRFKIRMHGYTTRRIIELDGIQLIQIPHDPDSSTAAKYRAKKDVQVNHKP
jgi:CRISPR-associated protein Cas2